MYIKRFGNVQKCCFYLDLNLNLDLNALGEEFKEFSTDYKLKLDTAIDTDAVLGKLNAKFTSSAFKDLKIPEFTMFFNKNDFYINKEWSERCGSLQRALRESRAQSSGVGRTNSSFGTVGHARR